MKGRNIKSRRDMSIKLTLKLRGGNVVVSDEPFHSMIAEEIGIDFDDVVNTGSYNTDTEEYSWVFNEDSV